MNIDDSDMFNIYTSNINKHSSNVLGINIYDSNNGVLASFDAFNRKILLGSGSAETAAISINNNIYTPNVIVCKCTYIPAVPAATEAQITTAKESATNVVNLLSPMLSLLNTAITTMPTSDIKTKAKAAYDVAVAKQTLASAAINNVQNALNAVNNANEAYNAAKNATSIATISVEGITEINASLANIKSKIDIALSDIAIASAVTSLPKIKLQFISNYLIKKDTFINFPIINNFKIPASQVGNPIYTNKILKFQVVDPNGILANTITIKEINIELILTGDSTSTIESTTTGYITAT